VPGYKTSGGNVQYRRRCIERAKEDPAYANELWVMCSRDLLFWVNTFVMTYNPRLVPKSTVIPWITYPFQDPAFDEIKDAIELGFDELSEKSRDMGASWGYLIVIAWLWLFRQYQAFRMMSRNEDLVDKTEDPDALFWKVMFIIKHLPSWMRPEYNKTHLHLKNLDNDSTMDGCSTTGDAARGGRCTAMLIDEFAAVVEGDAVLSSTRDVTKCRLFNSTHKGASTAFYRLSVGKIRKLVLHWSLHPEKARGLYYFKDGQRIIVNEFHGKVRLHDGVEVVFPDEYPFRLDGGLRSPWYDVECDRAVHPMEIAQELDMDPFSSDFQFFDPFMLQEIEKECVRLPYHQGYLEFNEDNFEPIGFVEAENGPLKLWIHPDNYGKLPVELEVGAGHDISTGTGASNSATSYVNLLTGEKIAEFADPNIRPEGFAKLSIATAKWFNNAFMIWDAGGPGGTFGETVIELGYRKIYYKRNEKSITKKVSDIPGVFLNPTEKRNTLGSYRRSLSERTFIQRSHEANQECLSFVFTTNNAIEHSASLNNIDPSGARASHGDRTTADALVNKLIKLLGNQKDGTEQKMPKNCYAARNREYELKLKKETEW